MVRPFSSPWRVAESRRLPRMLFFSFKGQVTKCALEHVRAASSLEQLAAGSWEAAIKELIEGIPVRDPGGGEPVEEVADSLDAIPEEHALPMEAPEEIGVSLAPASDVAAPTSMSTSTATASAAPGTPVGQLFQRPALQQSLSRARGQPLDVQLQQHALSRGQPSDFQAELRDAMECGLKRRTMSEGEFSGAGHSRRPSVVESEPPSTMRRTTRPPEGDVSEPSALHRLSSGPSGGPPVSSEPSALPRLSSEPSGGPSDHVPLPIGQPSVPTVEPTSRSPFEAWSCHVSSSSTCQ